LEHIRIALHDLLDFSTNPNYVAPEWPKDYWPKEAAPADGDAWDASVKAVKKDIADFEKLVGNPESNLYATIPWGDGQTLLREVLLAGQHTSYHLGQIVLLRRRVLGAWKGDLERASGNRQVILSMLTNERLRGQLCRPG
jgi:hypothetical protein